MFQWELMSKEACSDAERRLWEFPRETELAEWGYVCVYVCVHIHKWQKNQFSSVAQSCLTLCDPMNHSMPGLPVHHQLPESTKNPRPLSQWCHPTISSSVVPFSSCLNLSQHQGLFKWVSSSHQVAKVLEFQLQHQSLQWTPRTDLLQDGLVGSPCSPRDSS